MEESVHFDSEMSEQSNDLGGSSDDASSGQRDDRAQGITNYDSALG